VVQRAQRVGGWLGMNGTQGSCYLLPCP
jgi:hypothetical protein